jgi:hypothetical protein
VVVLDPVDGAGMEPNELMAAITERIDSVAGGLDGKIARLSLANISRESYKNLDHKALRALRTKALHLTLDITFVSATGDVSSMGKPGKGLLRDQLVDFSKTWDAPGISQIELAEMLERYLAKVEATHEAS